MSSIDWDKVISRAKWRERIYNAIAFTAGVGLLVCIFVLAYALTHL